jgi:hypothetical protein
LVGVPALREILEGIRGNFKKRAHERTLKSGFSFREKSRQKGWKDNGRPGGWQLLKGRDESRDFCGMRSLDGSLD